MTALLPYRHYFNSHHTFKELEAAWHMWARSRPAIKCSIKLKRSRFERYDYEMQCLYPKAEHLRLIREFVAQHEVIY